MHFPTITFESASDTTSVATTKHEHDHQARARSPSTSTSTVTTTTSTSMSTSTTTTSTCMTSSTPSSTPSQETLLAQVELLRDQLRDTKRQLTLSQRETRVARRDANMAHRENARLNERHHGERQQWMGALHSINHNIERLRESHDNMLALNVAVTINPEAVSKRHGFAVFLQLKNPAISLTEYELRFIVGQEVHVSSVVGDMAPDRVLFPFMEVNNAINLRNNFARVAKNRLVDTFGVEEARASEIVFRCCRSRFIKRQGGIQREEIEDYIISVIDGLLGETQRGFQAPATEFRQVYDQVIMDIVEQYDALTVP